MSILIRGMEMPKSCGECEFRVDESETNVHEWICLINQYPTFYCKKSQSHAEGEEYLQDCPLIEIPPHGRLIDADAMDTSILQEGFSYAITRRELRYTPGEVRQKIANAPTIIEAEEGEA